MDKEHREVIQVTKEIVIKFIETQRISPANFPEIFPAIYTVVQRTIAESAGEMLEKAAAGRS
jgi:predicted transcriptional regulator